jgi:hypothetical protein
MKSIIILLEIIGAIFSSVLFVHKRIGVLKKMFKNESSPQEKK